MKVLYDISVLGGASKNNLNRTGIFRVVENLALGLVTDPEVETFFCAMKEVLSSYQYLKAFSSFSQVPFICSRPLMKIERIKDVVSNKSRQMASCWKIPLKISAEALRFLIKFSQPQSLISNLEGKDIFHSPYLPIPTEIKRKRKVKKFLTVYDLIPLMYPEFFEFRKDHLLTKVVKSIGGGTRVLAISHSTKNDLCTYLPELDPDQVTVTHLAASSLFYPVSNRAVRSNILEKYSIPQKPYLLSLSTLEPRKNIDHTVRCFFKLVQEERLVDLNLVLVGSKGWNYNKIFYELKQYDFSRERVILTGYVADEDLSALYSGAIAFVYPSLYEGFGLPPLEAMQCGVPVITSNTSSLPEVVGDAGILVDPRDGDALCAAMLSLFQDSDRREMLARRSLKRAAEFSWKRCVDETVSAYKKAL